MNEPSKRPEADKRHEAIDVGDFVYAATGHRIRRLTMPDGSHWFPAVDVCKQLGHTNSRQALADHVPDGHREILETVTGAYGLSIPAGREWRRDLNVISLQGLIVLVNACTKPSCAPFKQWAAEVIETVQREGSYTLEEAEVQPSEPGAPIAYAMPEQVAEAIVRLEERNLQADEQLTVLSAQVDHAARGDPGDSACRPHRPADHGSGHGTHRGPARLPGPRTPGAHRRLVHFTDDGIRAGRLAPSVVRHAGRLDSGRRHRTGSRRGRGAPAAARIDRGSDGAVRAPRQRMPAAVAQARLHPLSGCVGGRISGVCAQPALTDPVNN